MVVERLGGHGQEGSETLIGLELPTKVRGDMATTSRCKFYENDADSMRMMT